MSLKVITHARDAVRDALSQWFDWLLIFDNTACPRDMEDFRLLASVYVLVTRCLDFTGAADIDGCAQGGRSRNTFLL